MRSPALWLPWLLLSTLLLPLAAADGDGHGAEPSTTVWDTPRTISGETYVVKEGERLVIRGTTITFTDATLEVQKGGELLVESTPERSAELEGLNQTWSTRMYGQAEILGLPDRPVVLRGIGGVAGFSPSAPVASFRGGFTAGLGTMTIRHAEFLDYNSGLMVGANATLAMHDVHFSSPYGAGLLLSGVHANLSDVSFEGAGGNLLMTLSLSHVTMRNLTFTESTRSLILRDSNVTVQGLTVVDSGGCVDILGGDRVDVRLDGVTCRDYQVVGIQVHRLQGTTSGNSSVRISNMELTSEAPTGNAITASNYGNFTIEDSVIGPLGGEVAGIAAEGALPDLRNVTFRGVGGWNAYLVTPGTIPREPVAGGEPGGKGWHTVSDLAEVRVLGAQGNEEGDALVRFYLESNGTLVAEKRIGMETKKLLFEVFRLTPDGQGHASTFRVIAEDASGRTTEVNGFDPTKGELVINMEGARGVPLGPAWALAAVALAALLRVGARRR